MHGVDIYFFPGTNDAALKDVGGKGLSLIQASKAGLLVPQGLVLGVRFFSDWQTALKNSPEWREYIDSKPEEVESACTKLKNFAAHLHFTEEQKSALAHALQDFSDDELFAVRSSSPNEDLEGASFAGGYETVLGVSKHTIEKAVQTCFRSLFDFRVATYMNANGLDARDLKIAVIVQKQIASEISGVGFSINPITNAYDEAVFNANWGLGETVVSGVITPDTYVVDKLTGSTLHANIGSKSFSVWLKANGGTEKKNEFRSADRTLTNDQLQALNTLLCRVETVYGKPIDIEWAFEKDTLYLLQARPITTYIPLSPEMQTRPGETKRLYFDVTLTVQAMTRPLSYAGTSMFRHLIKVIGAIAFLHDIAKSPDDSIPWISDGRIFVNLSNGFALVGRDKVLNAMSVMDPLSAKAIAALPKRQYTSLRNRIWLVPWGLLLKLPKIFFFIWQARRDPARTHAFVQAELKRFEALAQEISKKDQYLTETSEELFHAMFFHVFRYTVPLTFFSRHLLSKMIARTGNHPRASKLELALPNNVTIEMGLNLARMAKMVPQDLETAQIQSRIENKTLSKDFLNAWEQFMHTNGFRGPEEIDVASRRYRDDPTMLINLLHTTIQSMADDPVESFARKATERKAAYEELHAQIARESQKHAEQFAKDFAFFEQFGGYRETHKKYLVYAVGILRSRILEVGKDLVFKNRLDSLEQVFDLSFEQIDTAQLDETLDLRKLVDNNTAFVKKLSRVQYPPTLIDSRGFIPRAPRPPIKHGEVSGEGVSIGVVRGKVKILHRPDEKPLLKGEILVARATDPGWTPLFVNAGGIILEIGGSLQHGALVAREYGIPCVTGIANATQLWKDGAHVEIDGTNGIVRAVDPEKP